MMWGYGFNMGWMPWVWALTLVALGLVAFLVVWAVTAGARHDGSRDRDSRSSGYPGPSTPRQILDMRYARGELTTDEYRERLAALGEGERNGEQ
jgi:putative membrane protein